MSNAESPINQNQIYKHILLAILMYVAFFFVAIFFGFDMGSGPLFAYNHGAENHAELSNLFYKSLLLISIAGVVLAVTAVALSGVLARMFVGYNEHLTSLTRQAFCLFALSFALQGYNIFASGLFTAMNNGLISASIAFLRTFAFQSLSVLTLPILFGTSGIWWSAAVAEVGALLFSGYFVLRYRRRYGYM